MRCVVLEISGGGLKSTPPAGSRLAQTPAGARVKSAVFLLLTIFPMIFSFRSTSCKFTQHQDGWLCTTKRAHLFFYKYTSISAAAESIVFKLGVSNCECVYFTANKISHFRTRNEREWYWNSRPWKKHLKLRIKPQFHVGACPWQCSMHPPLTLGQLKAAVQNLENSWWGSAQGSRGRHLRGRTPKVRTLGAVL